MSPRRFRPRRIPRRLPGPRILRPRVLVPRGRHRRYIRRRTRRLFIGSAILLALAGTHRTYKIEDRDVDRLENYYGRPAEELTEEEIVSGMRHLGIQKIELDDDDRAKIYELDENDEDFKSSGKKYCMYCGEMLDSGANFCTSCGSKI
ncbi:MAG TPA: zinc ribbon domain-containing protein [candidate division Zixibacteria bacterium]|nr:zinc ribbon domain-containing protein [candidate division Zixibacteria bacterium]